MPESVPLQKKLEYLFFSFTLLFTELFMTIYCYYNNPLSILAKYQL